MAKIKQKEGSTPGKPVKVNQKGLKKLNKESGKIDKKKGEVPGKGKLQNGTVAVKKNKAGKGRRKFEGKKKQKKGGETSGGNSSLVTPTPPPKPKKLKKSPVNGSGSGGAVNNAPQGRPSPKQRKRNKQKRKQDNSEHKVEGETEEIKERIKNFKNKLGSNDSKKNVITKTIVKSGTGMKWFEYDPEDNPMDQPHAASDRKLTRDEISGLRKSATDLFERDCNAYKNACLQGDQKSDFQWMEKMMRVGTLPDRMAAYVVKIQDSPIHNLHHIQNLISMVKVQSKQQCLMAADTLKDLFLEDLLPPDRKLIPFDKKGSILINSNRAELIKAVFEDRLKTFYTSFIHALRSMSGDTVEKIRAKAVLIIYELLSSHPEQEAELLQMLVNKLGDPLKKVGSRGLFYLNRLLQNHPRMKLVVIDEVERLLFRNNIAKRAQYYGICFLNTINLENEHPEVACKLISVYVAFFKGCVKTGDIDSKMMSALLTGVNKSYPLAKEYGFQFTENIDTLYKITHLSNFNIGVQALAILFQLTDIEFRPQDADRYYRVLYRELLRPEIATTAHNLQFLNLVYRSMKNDQNKNRIMAFCKRLLQICQNVQPNLACSILYLISEVSKSHDGILNVGHIPADLDESLVELDDDEEDADSEDEAKKNEIINLMKISNVRVGVQDSENSDPVKNKMDQNNEDEEDNKDNLISIVDLNKSDIICEDSDDVKVEIKTEADYKQKLTEYDPYARNPAFSGAELSLFYEIKTLTEHYHPSVSLFANELLRKKHIVYEGNPLKDFTTTRFLERFVYKNSKKIKSAPGAPVAYQPTGLRNIPVNSADYLKNEEDKIPVEEKFFYHFFKEKKDLKQEPADETSDAESIGDEEFDQLMADYFKTPKGKKFGEEDEDSDDSEALDFAADMHSLPKNKKGKKSKNVDESEEEDDEMGDDDEGSDEDGFEAADADEMMDLDDDEFVDDDDDFHDEDGLEVFESGDFDEEPIQKKKKKKFGKGVDMFAPAEQFAEMLEANADGGLTGPNTLVNRDNADPKQLKWEMDRDRWVKGYKKSSKTKFSKKYSQKRKKQ